MRGAKYLFQFEGKKALKHFVWEGLTHLLLPGCIDFLQLSSARAVLWFRPRVGNCSECPRWVSVSKYLWNQCGEPLGCSLSTGSWHTCNFKSQTQTSALLTTSSWMMPCLPKHLSFFVYHGSVCLSPGPSRGLVSLSCSFFLGNLEWNILVLWTEIHIWAVPCSVLLPRRFCV